MGRESTQAITKKQLNTKESSNGVKGTKKKTIKHAENK